MSHFRRLDEKVLVAGQIGPDDVATAAAEGIVAIVNNRPDGEEPGQPDGIVIRAAAEAAGMGYFHIPVAGGVSPNMVADAAKVIEAAPGPVLFFCRSGTRSAFLWALARFSGGADGATLLGQAAAAGYDLSPIRPHLGG
ncbi:MAG TPA: TIGR01244 family sulfur transferase [Allosphingosinicella sp.]|nr:TIGR01244 family sulfur transferase [Allosphingosinicella sp.]